MLLSVFHWMVTARIVRGMTLSLKEREFVQAARFMGVPGWRIIFRHILPNMSSLLIIDATVNVSALILAEVGLSFFGFGVQPPDVSLGTLIGNNANAALTYPWQFYFPAASLVVLVLSINLVGDALASVIRTPRPDAMPPLHFLTSKTSRSRFEARPATSPRCAASRIRYGRAKCWALSGSRGRASRSRRWRLWVCCRRMRA